MATKMINAALELLAPLKITDQTIAYLPSHQQFKELNSSLYDQNVLLKWEFTTWEGFKTCLCLYQHSRSNQLAIKGIGLPLSITGNNRKLFSISDIKMNEASLKFLKSYKTHEVENDLFLLDFEFNKTPKILSISPNISPTKKEIYIKII
jgi:hypothetical protein